MALPSLQVRSWPEDDGGGGRHVSRLVRENEALRARVEELTAAAAAKELTAAAAANSNNPQCHIMGCCRYCCAAVARSFKKKKTPTVKHQKKIFSQEFRVEKPTVQLELRKPGEDRGEAKCTLKSYLYEICFDELESSAALQRRLPPVSPALPPAPLPEPAGTLLRLWGGGGGPQGPLLAAQSSAGTHSGAAEATRYLFGREQVMFRTFFGGKKRLRIKISETKSVGT